MGTAGRLGTSRDGEIRTSDPLLPKDIRGSEEVIGERGGRQEQADSVCPKVLSWGHTRQFVRPWCVLNAREGGRHPFAGGTRPHGHRIVPQVGQTAGISVGCASA
jgi:hypothetical protein